MTTAAIFAAGFFLGTGIAILGVMIGKLVIVMAEKN